MKEKNSANQNFPKKNSKGFTLIELIVVMAIIAIMTGIVFANYRNSQQQLALQRAASKLAQDVRRAQEMAMASEAFEGSIPEGGYGVYFTIIEPDHYILFADANGDREYDKDAIPKNELVEDIKIEKGVSIKALSGESFHIIFVPPNPDIYIIPGPGMIELIAGSKSRTIEINRAGLISIID